MKIVLYRPRLSMASGAGQLIAMQARGLRTAGAGVTVAAERGVLSYSLQTGTLARPRSASSIRQLSERADRTQLIVDHGACVPNADVTFVHNLFTAANEHSPRADWAALASAEARFFAALRPDTPIVANSRLVKNGLVAAFALDAARIVVHYPAYRSSVFSRGKAAALRAPARRALAVADGEPLIGFVTSGDFRKRGLDVFLAAAAEIAAAVPAARFLVVGSKCLPEDARAHALVRAGRVAYRPKDRHPERWMAALDLFLYPARYEEFGIVIAEAQALGVPVLTSRCVGAAECLPSVYSDWLVDELRADAFAAKTLELLGDTRARAALSEAALASITGFDESSYVRATVRTILDQKR